MHQCARELCLHEQWCFSGTNRLHLTLQWLLTGWIKKDQLDATCFIISLFNAQHVSDVNTSILGSLRLICWVISWIVLLWFDVCWCYVVVWLGWCGIRVQAEALRRARRADTLSTFMCRLSWNMGTSTSWKPQGLSRPVMGLLYLHQTIPYYIG